MGHVSCVTRGACLLRLIDKLKLPSPNLLTHCIIVCMYMDYIETIPLADSQWHERESFSSTISMIIETRYRHQPVYRQLCLTVAAGFPHRSCNNRQDGGLHAFRYLQLWFIKLLSVFWFLVYNWRSLTRNLRWMTEYKESFRFRATQAVVQITIKCLLKTLGRLSQVRMGFDMQPLSSFF